MPSANKLLRGGFYKQKHSEIKIYTKISSFIGMDYLGVYTKCLIIVEFVAAITSILNWHKWKNSLIKLFAFYLTVITVMETGFYILYHFKHFDKAGLIYEIQAPFEILFIHYFFYKTLINSKKKIIITTGCSIYILSLILEKTLFQNFTYYFQSLSYTIGNLFILVYIILYFIQLVNSDKLTAFYKLTQFWIVGGMLVFYLGTFPFYGLYNELAKNLDIFMTVAWVATSLNYCMYLLFTIGFIWGKPH
jgi:hypothetical protein